MNGPDRYHRQTLLSQIGDLGQEALSRARVVLVGCGALGSGIADQLVRAGVGWIRLIDRDVVELTNLHRQGLYDERDAALGTPKAVAAADRLRQVNSSVVVDPLVVDLHPGSAEKALLLGTDREPTVLIDGSDNAETRYLLNDLAVQHQIPWVYGACVGVEGRMMAIRPGVTPCLRCLFPDPPGPGELATCDTAGVLGPVAAQVASLQSTAAIQLIVGAETPLLRELMSIDVWRGRFHATALEGPRAGCRCCGRREFEFAAARTRKPVTLCGRNAVQVSPMGGNGSFSLEQVAKRLAGSLETEGTAYLVRFAVPEMTGLKMTLFADGRLIVQGTTDAERARSIYARFVGA